MSFLEIAGLIVLGTFALMFLLGFKSILNEAIRQAAKRRNDEE